MECNKKKTYSASTRLQQLARDVNLHKRLILAKTHNLAKYFFQTSNEPA